MAEERLRAQIATLYHLTCFYSSANIVVAKTPRKKYTVRSDMCALICYRIPNAAIKFMGLVSSCRVASCQHEVGQASRHSIAEVKATIVNIIVISGQPGRTLACIHRSLTRLLEDDCLKTVQWKCCLWPETLSTSSKTGNQLEVSK